MTPRWRLGILIMLMATLTACYQEAGETLQSTGSTAVPLPGDASQGEIIAPDDTAFDDEEPAGIDSEPDTTDVDPSLPTSIPLTIISQPTLDPALPALDTATPLAPELQVTATQPTFITPGSPLGPTGDQLTPDGGGSFTVPTPQGLITPTSFLDASGQQALDTADPSCIYTVRAGDNLYRIAINNGTTVEQMRNANPALTGENPVLQIGQQLRLPNCPGTGSAPSVQQPPVTEPQAIATSPPPAASGGQQTYTVQRGDTLFTIAQRFGTTVAALQQANQLANPDRLDIGQVLVIP